MPRKTNLAADGISNNDDAGRDESHVKKLILGQLVFYDTSMIANLVRMPHQACLQVGGLSPVESTVM